MTDSKDINTTETSNTNTIEAKNTNAVLSAMEAQLRDLQSQGRDLLAIGKDFLNQSKELETKLQLAKGTRNDIRVPTPKTKATLRERLEDLLAKAPHSQDEIAVELQVPVGHVSDLMKELKPRLRNVGTPDRPSWFLVPGKDVSKDALNEIIWALMSYRPFSYKELVEYTGAGMPRVAGAVGIAARNKKAVNVGSKVNPRWFLLPEPEK